MKDRDFLTWIHGRLTEVHNESPLKDYMHKLRAIIKITPKDQLTPNAGSSNNLHDLLKEIEKEERPSCQKCGKVTKGLLTQGGVINGKLGFYKYCWKCALGIKRVLNNA